MVERLAKTNEIVAVAFKAFRQHFYLHRVLDLERVDLGAVLHWADTHDVSPWMGLHWHVVGARYGVGTVGLAFKQQVGLGEYEIISHCDEMICLSALETYRSSSRTTFSTCGV